MKKVIYFTETDVPTEPEIAAIAKLNALASSSYDVNVSNAAVDNGLGVIEECDFVAGTIPAAYSAVDVFDEDAPPTPDNLPATVALVYDELALVVGGSTYTFTVADNEVTAIVVS